MKGLITECCRVEPDYIGTDIRSGKEANAWQCPKCYQWHPRCIHEHPISTKKNSKIHPTEKPKEPVK